MSESEQERREARIEAEQKRVQARFRAMYEMAKRGSLDGLADEVLAIATTNVNRTARILALGQKLRDARETMDGMDAALVDYDTTIKALRQEVLTLKAKLYDLMVA